MMGGKQKGAAAEQQTAVAAQTASVQGTIELSLRVMLVGVLSVVAQG